VFVHVQLKEVVPAHDRVVVLVNNVMTRIWKGRRMRMRMRTRMRMRMRVRVRRRRRRRSIQVAWSVSFLEEPESGNQNK
jgi:hypothetical protein